MFILYENDEANMQSNKIRYLNETILINKWNELQKMSNQIHSYDSHNSHNSHNFLEKDLLNKNTQFIFIDENRIIFSGKDENNFDSVSPSISPIVSPRVSPRVSPPPLNNYHNYIPFVPYDEPIKNLNKNNFNNKFSKNYIDYEKIIANKHFHIYENYIFVSFLIFLFIISSTVFFFCLTFSNDKFYSNYKNYKYYNLSKKKRITNNNDLTCSLIVDNV